MRSSCITLVASVSLLTACAVSGLHGSRFDGGSDGGTRSDGATSIDFAIPRVDFASNPCGDLVECAGSCVDTSSDPRNCGRCGNVCPSLGTCVSGACEASACSGGQVMCSDGVCHDLQSDPGNCGNCGNVCASGDTCVSGGCMTVSSSCGTTGGTTYGNAAPFTMNSSHAADDLLGGPISIPTTVTLEKLGVITRSTGWRVMMALYTDAGGRPGTLVATTAITQSTCLGNLEMPVAQKTLQPGTYWIMGIYDTSASIGIDYSNTGAPVHWNPLAFGTPPPSVWPQSDMTYNGQTFNYYVVVR